MRQFTSGAAHLDVAHGAAGAVAVTLTNWVPRCASWALRAIGNGMERPAFKRSCADRDKLGSCAIDCTYLSNDVADNEAVSAFGGGFKKNQGRKLVQPLVI